MMKYADNIFKIIIIFLLAGVIVFDALLYHSFEKLKTQIDTISDQLQLNSNQYQSQQGRLESLSKELENSQQELANAAKDLQGVEQDVQDQKNALIEEIQKRQQVADSQKSLETSIIDLRAEADAVKHDAQAWQKDYVGVLAQLEKKITAADHEIKTFEDSVSGMNIAAMKEDVDSLKAGVARLSAAAATVPTQPSSQDTVEQQHFSSSQ